MKTYVFLSLLFSALHFGFAQKNDAINWVSLEKAGELQEDLNKPLFVMFYTDWCGWCRKMNKSTFTDQAVIDHINENYIAVRFNAESKEEVKFRGKTYRYVKTSNGRQGIHFFAYLKLQGQMSYPSGVILDTEGKTTKFLKGYLTAEQLLSEIKS